MNIHKKSQWEAKMRCEICGEDVKSYGRLCEDHSTATWSVSSKTISFSNSDYDDGLTEKKKKILNLPISRLDLPTMIKSALGANRIDINAIGDLIEYSEKELITVPGIKRIGQSAVDKIKAALKKRKLHLRQDKPQQQNAQL